MSSPLPGRGATACLVLLILLSWALPAGSASSVEKADRVVIEKSKRKMTLLRQEKEIRSYNIALGRDPNGPKFQQGDNKTPEGL